VGKPVWNRKLPLATSRADGGDSVTGLEEGRTGRIAAIFSAEFLVYSGPVFAGSEAARAVTSKLCKNHPLISINIKIKRIARDSFK
jgi:hypothetical protein